MTDVPADPTEPPSHDQKPRRRRWQLISITAVIVGLGVAAVVRVSDGSTPTDLEAGDGEQAPAFRLPGLADPDETITLESADGRPVILTFWASWCVPCRREMPAFEALHQKLGGRVAFIGINHQDRRADALDLLADTGVKYPNGHDAQGEVARSYGLYGMPTTVFISADGAILARRTGEISADQLERTVDELLLDR